MKTKIKKSTVSKTKHEPQMSEVSASIDIPETKNTISKLELDLGRGDLNLLRDKLNEVIEKTCQ